MDSAVSDVDFNFTAVLMMLVKAPAGQPPATLVRFGGNDRYRRGSPGVSFRHLSPVEGLFLPVFHGQVVGYAGCKGIPADRIIKTDGA
jgi:hypothetical protein